MKPSTLLRPQTAIKKINRKPNEINGLAGHPYASARSPTVTFDNENKSTPSTGIGAAQTELTQVQIERQAAQRDARASVSALWTRLASLEDRIRRLQESVLPALADNQQLSIKSQQAGQIGLLELIVVSRQSLDARRDLIDALADYQSTRIALELAAGWPQEGTQP